MMHFFSSVFLSLRYGGKGTDPEKEEEIVLKKQFNCTLGSATKEGESVESKLDKEEKE